VFGLVASFDPVKQANESMANVVPGILVLPVDIFPNVLACLTNISNLQFDIFAGWQVERLDQVAIGLSKVYLES